VEVVPTLFVKVWSPLHGYFYPFISCLSCILAIVVHLVTYLDDLLNCCSPKIKRKYNFFSDLCKPFHLV
jgi:hypothetical protein